MKLKNIKYILVTSPILLSGCWFSEQATKIGKSAPEVLDAAGDAMVAGGNPPLVVAGLAIGLLGTIWKTVRDGMTFKETVSSIQDGVDEMTDEQKVLFYKTVSTSMPASVKKAVIKVKKALGK